MLWPPLAALAIAPSKAEELLFHVGKAVLEVFG